MSDYEFHGWARRPGTSAALHIGNLPGRKSVCLYSIDGNVIHVHAYFRSYDEAVKASRILDRIIAP